MKFIKTIWLCRMRLNLIIMLSILLLASSNLANAQDPPPHPISVTWKNQNLSFGSFYQGVSGGSVIINSAGGRSVTGTVVAFGIGAFSAALFEVVANPGTVISFLKPVSTLTDGLGHSMSFQIDDTDPASTFVTNLPYGTGTAVNIGGILTVSTPAANPPGDYTGTFDLTFVQE